MTYHSAKSLAEAGKDGFPKCRIDVRVDVERTQIQCGGPVRHMPDGQDAEFTSASSSAKTKRRHLAKSAVGWLSGRETGGGRKRDRKRRKNCSREGKWTRAAKRDSADEQTGSPCRKLLSRWGTQAQNERWPQGGPTTRPQPPVRRYPVVASQGQGCSLAACTALALIGSCECLRCPAQSGSSRATQAKAVILNPKRKKVLPPSPSTCTCGQQTRQPTRASSSDTKPSGSVEVSGTLSLRTWEDARMQMEFLQQ